MVRPQLCVYVCACACVHACVCENKKQLYVCRSLCADLYLFAVLANLLRSALCCFINHFQPDGCVCLNGGVPNSSLTSVFQMCLSERRLNVSVPFLMRLRFFLFCFEVRAMSYFVSNFVCDASHGTNVPRKPTVCWLCLQAGRALNNDV